MNQYFYPKTSYLTTKVQKTYLVKLNDGLHELLAYIYAPFCLLPLNVMSNISVSNYHVLDDYIACIYQKVSEIALDIPRELCLEVINEVVEWERKIPNNRCNPINGKRHDIENYSADKYYTL